MTLSIVTTLYCSAPHLQEFYTRASRAAAALTPHYEIVLVNDGSPDNSLELARELVARDERVRVVDLSRNFGHHKAMMTGLAHARGDLVFLLDVDLEEEPELLQPFHDELRRTGADVVYGVQKARKGGFFERISGPLFYRFFNSLSDTPIPQDLLTARLMTRRYVSALLQHRDQSVCIAGLWATTGFQQVPLTVTKLSRSRSTYSFRKKLVLLVNALTSFSSKPLVMVFYLGCLVLLTSTVAAGYLVIKRIFFGEMMDGWPSLIVSIWMLGGLQLFCMGVLGIYLSRIFMETKQRPYTVVREVYARPPASGELIGEYAAQVDAPERQGTGRRTGW